MSSTSMNKPEACGSKLFKAKITTTHLEKGMKIEVVVTTESIQFDFEFDDFEELACHLGSLLHSEPDKRKGSKAVVTNWFRDAPHHLLCDPIIDGLKNLEDPEVARDAFKDSSIKLNSEKDEGAPGISYINLELSIKFPDGKVIRHIFEPWDPCTLPFQDRRKVHGARQVVQIEEVIKAVEVVVAEEVVQDTKVIHFEELSEEGKHDYDCIATFDGALQQSKDILHRRCGCGGSALLLGNKTSPFSYVGREMSTFSHVLRNTLKSSEAEAAGAARTAQLVKDFIKTDKKVAILGDHFDLIKALRNFRPRSFRHSKNIRKIITEINIRLKPYDWTAFKTSRLLNKVADDWARYATGPSKPGRISEDPLPPMSGQKPLQILPLQPLPAPQQMQQPQYPSPTGEICTLWIGNLHHEMDEEYVTSCFSQTEKVLSVKLIRNKQTGQLEGYGFIEFSNRAAAEKILQSYTGQLMPNTEQPFRLNWASLSAGDRRGDDGTDYTIFVGDLAADVTDYVLQETFRPHYSSVKGGKVVTDRVTGHSKGYGFVRFGDANEQARALTEMNGKYCSSKPMQIGAATTKKNMGAHDPDDGQHSRGSVAGSMGCLPRQRGDGSE